MDWDFAIEKHRDALKRILAMLAAMAGLSDGAPESPYPLQGGVGGGGTLPRHLHRFILRLLRCAEAAARRLIVVVARRLVVLPGPQRPSKSDQISPFGRSGPVLTPSVSHAGPRRLSLPLLDPLPGGFHRPHPATLTMPRISFPGWSNPVPVASRHPPAPDDLLDADRLHRRLAALVLALDDLPCQAKRLARWRSRRRRGRFHRVSPLRGGHPPGWRKPGSRRAHEIHTVLDELHGLAFWAQEKPDTS
jgi:hypothetical protein